MIEERKLIRNAARCLKCDTVIESKHGHDWQSCKCGAVFVDGGLGYIRRGWTPGEDGLSYDECVEDLNEYEGDSK